MLTWYALYTKPHSELQVERALAAKGIAAYLPALPAPRRAGRARMRPYFPCYLFAQADLDVVGLSGLNWIPGMRHVVCFAEVPARIDDRVITAIRQRLDQPLALDERGEMLEHGDQVIIAAEPFQGVQAIFDRRLSSAGRVRVLIQMLRRWTAVEIEAKFLHKSTASPRRTFIASPRQI